MRVLGAALVVGAVASSLEDEVSELRDGSLVAFGDGYHPTAVYCKGFVVECFRPDCCFFGGVLRTMSLVAGLFGGFSACVHRSRGP